MERARSLLDFMEEGWAPQAMEIIPPPHWGPENPVRCEDYTTCSVAWAKNGTASGIIIIEDDGLLSNARRSGRSPLLDFSLCRDQTLPGSCFHD